MNVGPPSHANGSLPLLEKEYDIIGCEIWYPFFLRDASLKQKDNWSKQIWILLQFLSDGY